MNYQVADDAKQTIGNPSASGEAIQLPFAAPLIWWTNGRPDRSKDAGILYTGGWATKGIDYDMGVAEYGPLPHWAETLTDMSGDMGRLYETEYIGVCPIAGRRRWMSKEDGADFTGGWLQQLCILGVYDGEKFNPWGPVVVSTKVYAAKRFGQFINDWAMQLSDVRREHAPNTPSWYFFMSVGYFGGKPNWVTKGKDKTATYSLPELFQYQDITKEVLDKTFIGTGWTAKMAKYKLAAEEWLNDKNWRDDPNAGESSEPQNTPYPEDPYQGKPRDVQDERPTDAPPEPPPPPPRPNFP